MPFLSRNIKPPRCVDSKYHTDYNKQAHSEIGHDRLHFLFKVFAFSSDV